MKESVHKRAEAGAAVIVSSHMLRFVEDMCTHLLIIHMGKRLYFGPIEDARAAFTDLAGDASLEEVFFRATEGDGASPVNGV